MFVCPKCNTAYENAVNFCGVCGADVRGAAVGKPERAAMADPLIGMVVADRYRLLEVLGRGGMGVVYKAEHVRMGKLMAIKLLHGDLRRERGIVGRFNREAKAASLLSHMNTVQIFDFGASESLMYLVMEYIEGTDLGSLVRLEGPLPFKRAGLIMSQVLASLSEAHDKGVVHRDLKPENILVTKTHEGEPFVKVLDFGLAKMREPEQGTKLTADGSILGTPYYMSPEQIQSDEVDGRTDIYALGGVMYTALSGKAPFLGDNPMAIISKHLTAAPEPLAAKFPGLPADADRIIGKAMAKKRPDRYQTADEMRRDILKAMEGGQAEIRPSAIQEAKPAPTAPYEIGAPPPEASTKGWEMGESQDIATAPTFMADVKDLPSIASTTLETEAKQPAPKPEATKPAKTTPPRKGPKLPTTSVLLDGRTLSISTKMDFMDYEKRLKRRKLAGWIVIAVLLVLVAGVVTWRLVAGRMRVESTEESEPNNKYEEAKPMQEGRAVTGRIGEMIDVNTPDSDWYVLTLPSGPKLLRAELSGVPGVDLILQVVQPGIDDPTLSTITANNGTEGDGEAIADLNVTTSQIYLLVREYWNPKIGRPPKADIQAPYQLVYKLLSRDEYEAETNNAQSQASPIAPGKAKKGFLDNLEDVDWYCFAKGPVGGKGIKVTVTGVPGGDIKVTYAPASGNPIEQNQSGAGQAEILETAVEGDSGCISVGWAVVPADEKGRPFDPYQITAVWTDNPPPPPAPAAPPTPPKEDKKTKKTKKKT